MHWPKIKIKLDTTNTKRSRFWYGWFDRNYFQVTENDFDFEVVVPDYDYPEKWSYDRKNIIIDLTWEGQDKKQYPAANGHLNLYDYVNDDTLILNGNEQEDIWANTTYSFVNMFKSNTPSPKKEKFGICLNRRDKTHRTKVIEFLKEKNYIDDFIWSYKANEDEYGEDSVLVDGVIDGLKQHQPTDLFGKTYFNIVTESLFEEPGLPIFLTEKTFKALYNKNLFVICGGYGCVDALRLKGFDVFDDIINHDYDLIEDYNERLQKCLESIEKVMNHKSEIESLYLYGNIEERLEYNKKLVLKTPSRHVKEVYEKLCQLK